MNIFVENNVLRKVAIFLLLTIQCSYITASIVSMGWTTNAYGRSIINYQFPGDDIKIVVTATYTACLLQCQNTSMCTHVSYNYNVNSVIPGSTANGCHLKSNLGIIQDKVVYTKGYDSGIFSLSTGWLSNDFGQYLVDHDLPGDDIGLIVAATFIDCLNHCSNIPGCTHVTYNYNPRFLLRGHTPKWCYLKSNPSISPSHATPVIGYQTEILIS